MPPLEMHVRPLEVHTPPLEGDVGLEMMHMSFANPRLPFQACDCALWVTDFGLRIVGGALGVARLGLGMLHMGFWSVYRGVGSDDSPA